MRERQSGPVLEVRAIAGLHVVVLAWNIKQEITLAQGDDLPNPLKDLLGFAIEREELDGNDHVIERYMLRGIKRFKDKDQGLAAGTPVPLDEHPIQSFCWSDFTVKPDTRYAYRVIPATGKPKSLTVDAATGTRVVVRTEPEVDSTAAAAAPRHDIYFNRGVIGSQAYARRFLNEAPDADNPNSAAMKWLSRGLYEAFLAFVARAKDEHFGLRAAFYEFHYQPAVNAFRRAVDAGADVKIVFDGESSYKTGNIQALMNADLFHNDLQTARTVTEGIRHNKFCVLLEDGDPIAVWTGSTNISDGGIFGHSNVGHVVWDQGIADQYLKYWERLEKNMTPGKLRAPNSAASPTPAGKPPANSVLALFSARDGKDENTTLQWYADRMNDAKRIACLTVAFGIDDVFQQVIQQDNDVLRYIVKDDDLGTGENIGQDRDVIFAGGGHLADGALTNFLAERGNPLNSNDYIHTKFMLVDPLGKDPLVVTGSANFSRPSQRSNDENMLVIRGDLRVADIYFGEFMRIFDHHYARYVVKKLSGAGTGDPDAGYLKDKAEDWVVPHFSSWSYKSKRRLYFMEEG